MFDDILKFPKKVDVEDDEKYKKELRSYKSKMDERIMEMGKREYTQSLIEIYRDDDVRKAGRLCTEWLGNVRTNENEKLSAFRTRMAKKSDDYFYISPFFNFKDIYEEQFL